MSSAEAHPFQGAGSGGQARTLVTEGYWDLMKGEGGKSAMPWGWETAGSRVEWGQSPAVGCIAHFSGVPLVEGMQLGISHSPQAFPDG